MLNRFPEVLNERPTGRIVEPEAERIIIDKTRVLIALKESHNIEIKGILQETEFILEGSEDGRMQERINNTNKRYWLRLRIRGSINDENLNRLREVFGENLDWIGPVYVLPNEEERRGSFCPLPNVLLIKFTSAFNSKEEEFNRALLSHNMKEVPEKSKYLGEYRYYVITNIEKENAYQIKEILQNEFDFISEIVYEHMPMILPTSFAPNDTHFADQWNMTRIKADAAWNLMTGNSSVVICILDSGCDLNHNDLQFSTPGIDLSTMMPDGSPGASADPNHGTACAGIAAAIFNNARGVAGVAGGCRIMPLAFQNFTNAECAAGINFAATNGANVISMSFSFPSSTTIVDNAIQNAFNNDIVMCAATGNGNANAIAYPARHPQVMACGASDPIDNRKTPTSPDGENWWGSNFGNRMSVVAPGVLIPTTDRLGADGYNPPPPPPAPPVPGQYSDTDYARFFNGTSAATPHVAGLAALIRSLHPTLKSTEVQDMIERNAEKVGTGHGGYRDTAGHPNGTWNQQMGYGRINVIRALVDMNNLWINWKGSGNDNLNAMNVFVSSSKQVYGYTSALSPSIEAFNGSYWMAWRGDNEDKLHIVDLFNLGSLITLEETSPHSPALSIFEGNLWIAWTGSSNEKINVMNVFDPSTKRVLNETSDTSPSISGEISDFLWIAWKGSGNETLNVMSYIPSSNTGTKTILNETSTHAPSIALERFSGRWIAWKGSGNDNLNLMNPFNLSTKMVLDEESDTSPSITGFRERLWIAWKGSGNENLNVMNKNDFSTKRTLDETSTHSPSIASFDLESQN
jgi:subtilisin family serine protease